VRPVRILGIGGSTRSGSTAECALRASLAVAEKHGAEVRALGGADLMMPLYDPAAARLDPAARVLLDEVVRADGVVLASPAYHGSTSGLVKNALDHVEELRGHERPYLSGRAVGCLTVAQGWQSGVATLSALRTIVHALRGWPTPLGVVVNTAVAGFTPSGECADEHLQAQIETMTRQVVDFARLNATDGHCRLT
jgi:FMN reductase